MIIQLTQRIRNFIKSIPNSILMDLWIIGQEHDYASIREERDWNIEDEFWQQIGYRLREVG